MADFNQLELLYQAGINPRNGLPCKFGNDLALKESLKKTFRIVDEQDAINRYTWHNLPYGLNSQMIERILYYKGAAIMFYLPEMEKFFFLPYTLDGNIDCYGRYMGVTPVPFSGGKSDNAKGKEKAWIPGLTFKPEYDIVLPEYWNPKKLKESCVIVNDYTPQISQKIIPRYELQEPIIDMMSEIVPYCRTALELSTGVQGVRVQNEDDQSNVDVANSQLRNAALTGKGFVPIVAKLDFQSLTSGAIARSEEYLLSLQALDNLRLSHLGLSNGGLFQKKSHMLESEQEMNTAAASLVLQDGLTQRQRACDIINSITASGVWVETTEQASNIDKNMDGELVDNTDESVQTQSQYMEMEDNINE